MQAFYCSQCDTILVRKSSSTELPVDHLHANGDWCAIQFVDTYPDTWNEWDVVSTAREELETFGLSRNHVYEKSVEFAHI